MSATVPALDEYGRFCDGVRRVCGIDLSQYKRDQMERRIRSFIAQRGGGELLDYLEQVRREPAELDAFLDRVTINVSQLWRNPDQWAKLAKDVLPDLGAKGAIKAWSAGCSYGAEAHTLSAICHDVLGAGAFRITGTDIDKRMVAKARAGRFSAADGRDAPADALQRHFDVVEGGELQAREHVRRPLAFEQGDLLRVQPRPASFDLVLCRNTVIYFTQDVRDDLHARLAASLRPGGRLVIGATERVSDPAGIGLVPESPFCLRKA